MPVEPRYAQDPRWARGVIDLTILATKPGAAEVPIVHCNIATYNGQPCLRYRQVWLIDSLWEGTTRAEDARGTPTQNHISPNIPVYDDYDHHVAIVEVGLCHSQAV